MRTYHPNREFAFILSDVARLFRTYADQEVRRLGMTRAQWAVMVRLERHEGLKQSELAEMLEIQPITLTRLVDRLCDSGLIERRSDPQDRRAKRLYLTAAAKPLMDRLDALGRTLLENVLAGVSAPEVSRIVGDLRIIKDNLRRKLQDNDEEKSKRYG